MNKKKLFKISALASSLLLMACDDVSLPVEEDFAPVETDALLIIDDGLTTSDFNVFVGSNSDGYNRVALAKGDSYARTSALAVTPSDNNGVYTWRVDTYSAGDDAVAEVYFTVASDSVSLDLTEYQNGLMLIDLSVLVAASGDTADHQIHLQTNTGTDDYKNRNAFYFSQNQLADLEAGGWVTVAIPMSCFSPQDPTGMFDISAVNEALRFVIKGNESVSYEIGKVAFDTSAELPEGAVAWTCE